MNRPDAQQGFTSSKRYAQQGFTLVEMMIALLIFGILSAAGVMLLTSAVRAQAAAGRKLDDLSALQQFDAIMSADLAQATPRATRDEAGTLRPAFEGGNGQPLLRLVRAGWDNPDNARRPGLQKVEYRLANGVLDRVAYPMLDGAAPLPPARMMDHVTSAVVRYRVRGAWSDRWQGQPGAPLPDAIELRLIRGDGTALRELFLVGSQYRAPPQPAGAGDAS